MSSSRAFTSQLTSGRIGGSGSLRPGGKAMRMFHLRAPAQAEGIAQAERPAGLDLLNYRVAAAE